MSGVTDDHLSFLFKIDFIKPDLDKQPEIRTKGDHWSPPTIPEAITTIDTTGWRKWTRHHIQEARRVSEKDLKVCSLFYNSECDHYLGLHFDCREVNVENFCRQEGIGWRRVMFRYVANDDDDTTPISVMGFDLAEHVLAARASTSPWMPQLIPKTYANNCEDTGECYEKTGIAGDLSLLMAFAAFASDLRAPVPRNVLNYIERCFRPPEWWRHGDKIKRKHGTGVVVSIRLDPEANISEDHLKNLQNGKLGPILEA